MRVLAMYPSREWTRAERLRTGVSFRDLSVLARISLPQPGGLLDHQLSAREVLSVERRAALLSKASLHVAERLDDLPVADVHEIWTPAPSSRLLRRSGSASGSWHGRLRRRRPPARTTRSGRQWAPARSGGGRRIPR